MGGYNEHLGHNQMPGLGPLVEQQTVEFQEDIGHAAYDGVRIHKDTDDEGNVGSEHKLRPGLALVRIEAGGNAGMYADLDHADAPANADIKDVVILADWTDLKDKAGARQDVQAKVLIHGQVTNSKVVYNGADATRQAAAQAKAKLIRFV